MATLLSTVSHLCEEGGPGGVAGGGPARLNSVLSGSAQVLGSPAVLPHLGLGSSGAGNGIRGSAGGGFTLGSLTGPGTGSSLSSLASAHLSSVTPPVDSLTRLRLQDPSLAPSLSALASTHLAGAANTPPRPGFSLGSLQGPAPSPDTPSLSALASTHLAGSGATRQGGLGLSRNKIPAQLATQPHLPILPPGPALAQQAGRSPSPRLEIDLMAALKVHSKYDIQPGNWEVRRCTLHTVLHSFLRFYQ